MPLGNLPYLTSFSGIFRLLTVICGIPAVILSWFAYFSSSWTTAFPAIQAILEADRKDTDFPSRKNESGESSEEQFDLISDKDEKLLDQILLETLMYEKFFIGFVTVVCVISIVYLLLRVAHSQQTHESPYEIIIDFLFHVISALGLLTGSALILLSAAKIEKFVDKIDDNLPPAVIDIINSKEVQDKADKIAAGVLGMLNGIIYALCVVTLRMVQHNDCCLKTRKKSDDIADTESTSTASSMRKLDYLPRYSIFSVNYPDARRASIVSHNTPAFYME